jgi:hypothetical protein
MALGSWPHQAYRLRPRFVRLPLGRAVAVAAVAAVVALLALGVFQAVLVWLTLD